MIGMHKTGHGQTVFRFIVKNAVATANDCAGFSALLIAALQNCMHSRFRHVLRNAHHVKRELRLTAHCINIRERICCGDLTEQIRIIGYRRKEIYRLHNCELRTDTIYGGVVALIESDKEVRIRKCRQVAEQLGEDACADFCTASCAF